MTHRIDLVKFAKKFNYEKHTLMCIISNMCVCVHRTVLNFNDFRLGPLSFKSTYITATGFC